MSKKHALHKKMAHDQRMQEKHTFSKRKNVNNWISVGENAKISARVNVHVSVRVSVRVNVPISVQYLVPRS